MNLWPLLGPGMTPTASRLSWIIQKKRHLVHSFFLRRAPEFVYRRSPKPLTGEIPVFTFHGVVPDIFEAQCEFLVRNGYRTLTADEFRRRMTGEEEIREPSVLLTFDDGLKQVWTVAHPILEKYGLKAVCFLIPGCISDGQTGVRPTLRDVWEGSAAESNVVSIRPDEPPLATWDEIALMHETGVFSFHSHTMYHALVPTSDQIFAFMSPKYHPYHFGNIHVPMYTAKGEDAPAREPTPGLPIFFSMPRMQADRRFLPDEALLEQCTSFVRQRGTEAFFQDPAWRKKLEGTVKAYFRRRGRLGRWEPADKRDERVRGELADSRRAIEQRLPGARVDQLCFPWFSGEPFALKAALDVGFDTIYFGQLPNRPTNRPGQDLCSVARLDDVYLERLPGEGRKGFSEFINTMLVNALSARRSVSGRLFVARTS